MSPPFLFGVDPVVEYVPGNAITPRTKTPEPAQFESASIDSDAFDRSRSQIFRIAAVLWNSEIEPVEKNLFEAWYDLL
jgi:hypothetical protein